MFSTFGKRVLERQLEHLLFESQIGLEVERQRIDGNGSLSRFPYPQNIGNQETNQWITTDFMATMTEIATPVAHSPRQALRYLEQVSNILRRGLADGEYLWPLSMPPRLPADHGEVAITSTTQEKREYSAAWLKQHELQEATPCGVHVNISINDRLLDDLTVEERNRLYIRIAQGFLRYRFLLTYLYGASPLAEENYFLHNQGPVSLARSIRQSKHGFGTKFDGDFSDTDHYVRRIEQGLQTGQLLAEHDFHSPVRLKGPDRVNQLPVLGTKYLELRMLDLNPWASVGIDSDALNLLCLMAAYFLMTDAQPFSLADSNAANEEVALEEPTSPCHYEGQINSFLDQLSTFAAAVQAGQDVYDLLQRIKFKVAHPQQTVGGQLVAYISEGSLSGFALKRAVDYQERSGRAVNVYQEFGDRKVLSPRALKRILGA